MDALRILLVPGKQFHDGEPEGNADARSTRGCSARNGPQAGLESGACCGRPGACGTEYLQAFGEGKGSGMLAGLFWKPDATVLAKVFVIAKDTLASEDQTLSGSLIEDTAIVFQNRNVLPGDQRHRSSGFCDRGGPIRKVRLQHQRCESRRRSAD